MENRRSPIEIDRAFEPLALTAISHNRSSSIHKGNPVDQNKPDLKRHENPAPTHHEVSDDFDFIVCGAGSSGSVIAARLAQCGSARVLLLEAGGDDVRATGVDVLVNGQRCAFTARCETVLSLGAINTPKVLMQSGIGPRDELKAHGISVVQHLPGVGRNHQDHLAFGCTWAYRKPEGIGGGGCEAKLYWKSDSRLSQPDILQCQLEFAVPSPVETGLETPAHGWTMFSGLAQPKSRGRLRLSGPNTNDPILIEPNSLSEPEDVAAALAAVELCRELGNSDAFTPWSRAKQCAPKPSALAAKSRGSRTRSRS
ncbi:hypothetical protein GHK50_29920 [Sinorhizobium medicae]|uniref:Glucose-methanol-choline oxidoreductase N-terminal domain-containing protein n=1 Tax=Sinorhizobium medicae TaxID=110321 RepID=A0A6G1WDR2_9HYPH|nr:hypothetical protein [Sinorhizobium medicae]MQX87096.1 hypothetical protein [Sinorhizobium medicae]